MMLIDEKQRQDALEREKITDTPRDEAFDRVVRLACAALEMPVGAITFVEAERQWIKAAEGTDVAETPRGESFCTHAILDNDVMVVEDATQDPRFCNNPHVTAAGGIRFYAGAPITTKDGFRLGALCVVDHVQRKITARHCSLLKDMADVVVSEMQLRHTAGTDKLTGLYNRQFLDELGSREIARARRQGSALTAALIDADKFKHINDTYGHPAGDAVLCGLGPAIKRVLRATDILARYGGEELVLLLPGTSLKQAAPVLERLRKNVADMKVPEVKGHQVTASIGAAELRDSDRTIADLLARADRALYVAKQAGRNRVELAVAA